jgi:hypothetical protein
MTKAKKPQAAPKAESAKKAAAGIKATSGKQTGSKGNLKAQDQAAQPTVLDWFESLLKLNPISIPEPGSLLAAKPVRERPVPERPAAALPGLAITARHLRLPIAVLFALIAQIRLESRAGDNVWLSIAFYLMAGALAGWGLWSGDLEFAAKETKQAKARSTRVRLPYLAAGIILAGLTYLAAGANQFRLPTVAFWFASVACVVIAFWAGAAPFKTTWKKLKRRLLRKGPVVKLDRWAVLVLAVLTVSAFFRFSALETVPGEMWSDHAEKFLDIIDVLNGEYSIFFPRNAGREAMQFYATAAAVKWFGADLSYSTLKTMMALVGFLTLPYIYLLGRELGGRRLGLVAMAIAGVASWPNIMSRVGLRAPLHPFLLAPVLYYFLRGIHRRSQNDFILSGVAIGLGVYGYSSARLTPLLIAMGVLIFVLHSQSRGRRLEALRWLGMAGLVAVAVAVPFLSVAYDLQDQVFYRTVTRVTGAERELAGEPLQILLSNMWHALRMFTWDFGEIWVLAVPFKPAVDWVTGALLHLGVVLLGVRYLRRKNWEDLFLLLSVPVLLLPSAMSLAFPGENPHPARAGGAMIPVYTIAAFTFLALLDWIKSTLEVEWVRRIGYGVLGTLVLLLALSNSNRVMQQYAEHVNRGLWNTSEVGAAARGFAESVGSFEEVYVVGFPHWLDSRLVALNAGLPGEDFGIYPDQIVNLPDTDQPRLFLLHSQDEVSLDILRQLYPNGTLEPGNSRVEGREFVLFWIPEGVSN